MVQLTDSMVNLAWPSEWLAANEERLWRAEIGHKVSGPKNLQYKPGMSGELFKGERTVQFYFWHTGEFKAHLFSLVDDDSAFYHVIVSLLETFPEFQSEMEKCYRFMSGPVLDEYGPRYSLKRA